VKQEINLGLLFDQAWMRMERLASGDEKVIRLEKQISETSFIEADPTLLEQALLNLLMNARHAIPEGGEIGVKDVATHDGFLQLQITDNGCGIAPEDLRKVFSPFFTKRKGGIGLGLSMAQKTIEAHGGKITIESTAGKGTKVTLRLPQRGSFPDKGVRNSNE
jgi:signal transduction histidine kinase